MVDIARRIKDCRKEVKLSQSAFGQCVGVSRDAINNVENGRAEVTDILIKSICREFGVDEIWLRTGVGEMFHARSRSEDIAAFMGDVLRAGDSDFRSRLVSALSRLSVEEWALLEQMAEKLAADEKKTEP